MGHLEAIIDFLTITLLGTDKMYEYEVMVDSKQINAKIDSLRSLADMKAASGAMVEADHLALQSFTTNLKALTTVRNHIVHGRWGLHVGRDDKLTPAADSPKRMANPFFSKQLPTTLAEFLEIGKEADEILKRFIPIFRNESDSDLPIGFVFQSRKRPSTK
jgi:hypothetical protein